MSFGSERCIHVEVMQKAESTVLPDSLHQPIVRFLESHYKDVVSVPFKFEKPWLSHMDPYVKENILRISAEGNCEGGSSNFPVNSVKFILHIYQLHDSGSVEEGLNTNDESSVTAALHWTLPTSEFDGLWESLFYDAPIKEQLLRYAQTALIFADAKVDSTIITMNRVILLHGPPGTGKTSLCKALAQKLAVRLSARFRVGQLIEINSHSLFSKYFSESGKLVLQMFQKINEFVEDPDAFVCVLIDEVESLTAARRGAMLGNEPSDALRVVNALLTQIDQLRKRSNVLLMTTSNLIDAIDAAFIDRADIKLHVQLPSLTASYHVLKSTVEELIRVKLLSGIIGVDPVGVSDTRIQSPCYTEAARKLLMVAKRAVEGGVSCRTLRKLAFLAYSEMTHVNNTVGSHVEAAVDVEEFLPLLAKALENALVDVSRMSEKSSANLPLKDGKENLPVDARGNMETA